MQAIRVALLQDCGAYLQLLTPSIAHLTVFMIRARTTSSTSTSSSTRSSRTRRRPTPIAAPAAPRRRTHRAPRRPLADELGIDPAEVRRRNFPTEFPYTTATGLSYDSGDYGKALDKALEMSDYAGFEARRAESAARGNYRGIGLSTWVEICGLAPSRRDEGDRHRAGRLGVVDRPHAPDRHRSTVITGSSAHGQGHETSWSQIVESELGIPFDQVEVVHGDTASAPYGLGTYGSRSLAVGGTALHRSIGKVRDKARLVAAHLLECSADDLEWDGGRWQVKGSPERAKTIQELGVRGLGRRLAARGRRAEPRGDDVLRPAELHVPVRLAHRRGRGRRRDRQGHDRALHGDRRLRQRHQPDDRRGPGARRHRRSRSRRRSSRRRSTTRTGRSSPARSSTT